MVRWHGVAAVYDAAMSVSGWRRAQVAFASDVHGSVLDVGCGTAFLADHLGPAYVGVDCSLDMLTRAATTRVICADATALPIADQAFDTVVTTGFLGLLEPRVRAAVLRELARVCREEVRLLEPVAPINVVRRGIALSRHPLEMSELAHAGLTARIAGPALYAGVYTPVTAQPG